MIFVRPINVRTASSAAVLCHPPSWCDAQLAHPAIVTETEVRVRVANIEEEDHRFSTVTSPPTIRSRWPCAVRKSSAPESSRASACPCTVRSPDRDTLAERCALFRPFVGNAGKAATAKTIIIEIEFAKNDGSEFGAANGAACFEAQGGRNAAHIGREVGVCRVYVHTDTEDDITNAIDLGGEFGEHSRELSVPIKISLGHLIDGARVVSAQSVRARSRSSVVAASCGAVRPAKPKTKALAGW